MHTKINWFEIPSADFQRATAFYERLFDTTLKVEQSGPVKMGIFNDATGESCGCVAHSEHYLPGKDGTVIYLDARPSIDRVIARIGWQTLCGPRSKATARADERSGSDCAILLLCIHRWRKTCHRPSMDSQY